MITPASPPTRERLTSLLRRDTVGGLLMLLAAVTALLWANLGTAGYEAVSTFVIGPMDVAHWASSGVLTIFFFLAGLELKQEFSDGSLAEPRKALVPIAAAVGGIIVPALIYLVINGAHPAGDHRGWAVPMATDIAFVMAILAIVGRGLPRALRAFLLTLAIVDDLGAILVIAVAFTADLSPVWLLAALACFVLWWLLQYRRRGAWYVFLPLGVLAWWCLHASGVHATIAGVVLGLLTRARRDPGEAAAPVQRWQHRWQPISSGLAVPVFALFAAGVTLEPELLGRLFSDPVALGVAAGFLLGKPIGITLTAWLTTRLTGAALDPSLHWRHVLAGGLLAGVGFTVAIFVTELAFGGGPEQDIAKTAVLLTSACAAVLGGGLLALMGRTGTATAGSGVRQTR